MIYLDSSVALSRIFAEPRRPPPEFWNQPILSSALLRYEVWNRVNAHTSNAQVRQDTTLLLSGVTTVQLRPDVLARALQPFPIPIRTLDGLHLSTMEYVRADLTALILASYDARLLAAAAAMGFATLEP